MLVNLVYCCENSISPHCHDDDPRSWIILTYNAFAQQRLLTNAPCQVEKHDLQLLYQGAMTYW